MPLTTEEVEDMQRWAVDFQNQVKRSAYFELEAIAALMHPLPEVYMEESTQFFDPLR